jgi:hypothetical protein
MAREEPDQDVVDRQQRRRADDAPGDGVVLPDDRVLDGVGQRQQHDEIERVELRELPFAGEPQHEDQKRIDDDRPEIFSAIGRPSANMLCQIWLCMRPLLPRVVQLPRRPRA